MTIQQQEEAAARTLFCKKYAEDIRQLGRALEKATAIIAISRKAPRLLELAILEGLLPASLLTKISTECSLPFWVDAPPESQSRMVICDDVLINGTTFARTASMARHLAQINDNTISSDPAGVVFRVNSLLVDSPTEQTKDLEHFVRAGNESELASFVYEEVAAFAALGKPYDIDHPIIYLDLRQDYDYESFNETLRELLLVVDTNVYSTERPYTNAQGRHVVAPTWNVVTENMDGHKGAFKIRVYINPERSRIAFFPVLLTCPDSRLMLSQLGCGKITEECLRNVEVRLSNIDKQDVELESLRERVLMTWRNYLLELSLATRFIPAIVSGLRGFSIEGASPYIDQFDLQLLFGPEISNDVFKSLTGLLSASLETENNGILPVHKASSIRDDSNLQEEVIPDEYAPAYHGLFNELAEGCKDCRELFETLFHAQHVAIERPSRTAKNPARLEFGVTVDYLKRIQGRFLSKADSFAEVTLAALHRALDELIDYGIAVPHYLKVSTAKEGYWIRAFRVGETRARLLAYVVKHCFKSIQMSLVPKKDSRLVGETLLEKYLVLCTEFLKIFDGAAFEMLPLISREFYLYGARARVDIGGRKEWLVDWAVDNRLLLRQRKEGLAPDGYECHPQVEEYYPDDDSPITGDVLLRLRSAARWVADYRQKVEGQKVEGQKVEERSLGSTFLTAITTVDSKWATKEAICAEIQGWLYHPKWSYEAIRRLLCEPGLHTNPKRMATLITLAGNMSIWAKQAKLKQKLSESFPHLISEAQKLWSIENNEEASDIWNHQILPAIRQHRYSSERALNLKECAVTADILSKFSDTLLSVLKYFGCVGNKTDSRESDYKLLHELMERSKLPSAVSTMFKEAENEIYRASREPEVASAIRMLIRSGDAFAAGAEHILTTYYSSETFNKSQVYISDEQYYVLMWDLIDSCKKPLPELITRIADTNRVIDSAFKGTLLAFDKTSLDDSATAVCTSLSTVLGVCQHLVDAFDPDLLRMGLVHTAQSPILQHERLDRPAGKPYQYAKRMMDILKEVENKPELTQWNEGQLTHPEIIGLVGKGNYVVVSEVAYRIACVEDREFIAKADKLPFRYKPRGVGLYHEDVYVVRLSAR